jgi:hypothetical protein
MMGIEKVNGGSLLHEKDEEGDAGLESAPGSELTADQECEFI